MLKVTRQGKTQVNGKFQNSQEVVYQSSRCVRDPALIRVKHLCLYLFSFVRFIRLNLAAGKLAAGVQHA